MVNGTGRETAALLSRGGRCAVQEVPIPVVVRAEGRGVGRVVVALRPCPTLFIHQANVSNAFVCMFQPACGRQVGRGVVAVMNNRPGRHATIGGITSAMGARQWWLWRRWFTEEQFIHTLAVCSPLNLHPSVTEALVVPGTNRREVAAVCGNSAHVQSTITDRAARWFW